ncbi:hypothetical protein HanXRQr2_Chr17g0785171 [Helianthus annuus]|uniref:Uncharacterized protein n=1 Tax=Helianthus annuus TaxID=4232 RepID=A0A9K3DFA2_HELAN|nr:hypothetical protein HanXRQr2_Chr17g0785171 [Helianthus annuus]KAJ0431806.1 hypothetical protein HanIR_Chr17g0852391 [Helianthus annuus]KAJ0811659.1 hypothetical protein HanPSC8_Chr17g0753201 [Helianthus annuus]
MICLSIACAASFILGWYLTILPSEECSFEITSSSLYLRFLFPSVMRRVLSFCCCTK